MRGHGLDRSGRLRHGPSRSAATRRLRPRAVPGLRVRRRGRAPRDAADRHTGHPPVPRERPALPGVGLMPSIRVPVSWLRDYVSIDASAEAIAERLHMAGMEVERIERSGGSWGDKVHVARITAIAKHPN